MKRCFITFLILSCGLLLHAEDVFLKDGKILHSQGLRRDGNFLFLKLVNPDGAISDTLLQVALVDHINFGEPPTLTEAKQQAYAGLPLGVLAKTDAILPSTRMFADIPGNLWTEVVRLRLPALAVAGTPESIASLQKQWLPTGDSDLESAAKLLFSSQIGTDQKALEATWRSLAVPGSNSLTAGISWIELGSLALGEKKWKDAIRAFLSVPVFSPTHRLLQPKALLGAIRALLAKGDLREAKSLIEELQAEYPNAPETKQATELMPQPDAPSLQNK